jgi:hypothetical protein
MKIKNTNVESTPFVEISIKGHGWLRLYWSANRGTYGYQVLGEYSNFEEIKEYKSSGCGYCKESHILELILKDILGYTPKKYDNTSSLFFRYRKGGNYYELTIEELRECVK